MMMSYLNVLRKEVRLFTLTRDLIGSGATDILEKSAMAESIENEELLGAELPKESSRSEIGLGRAVELASVC